MKTEKKRNKGRLLAVLLTGGFVFIAAGSYLRPTMAQNPAINSAKPATSMPAPDASSRTAKLDSYKVAEGQVIKELVLTGEMHAELSVEIIAPDIRSSFSNMITFLAPEGSRITKGERILEFDDSSLMSQRSEAERTLDECQEK